MDELKTPEERSDSQKSSGWPFSKDLTEAWEQLEERTRRRPGPHLLMALAIGYFLQIIPFENLLVLAVKLARPVLFLVCAFQLAKYISKGSHSGAEPK
jgi:hypothetical protein